MLGIKVKERPSIPTPEANIEYITIPGRDGSMTIRDGTLKDIVVSVPFIFKTQPNLFAEKFRNAKAWLMAKGSGRLCFSDDPDVFYKARNVVIGENERTVKKVGEFTAEFTCHGCQYLVDGQKEYTLDAVEYNPYFVSHPVYKIEGEGVCQLTVNGNTMRANVGQNLIIDTELMIAYREDGSLANTDVLGDYDELYLREGENRIDITSGFALKVIPNWRCL